MPTTYHFRLFGLELSNQLWTHLLALQLLCSQPPRSLLSAGCGLAAGALYRADVLGSRRWRVPRHLARVAHALATPLLGQDGGAPRRNNLAHYGAGMTTAAERYAQAADSYWGRATAFGTTQRQTTTATTTAAVAGGSATRRTGAGGGGGEGGAAGGRADERAARQQHEQSATASAAASAAMARLAEAQRASARPGTAAPATSPTAMTTTTMTRERSSEESGASAGADVRGEAAATAAAGGASGGGATSRSSARAAGAGFMREWTRGLTGEAPAQPTAE